MARLTANLFHLVLMPVRNHLTYITYLNFCFYILPVTITVQGEICSSAAMSSVWQLEAIKRNTSISRSVSRVSSSGRKSHPHLHIHLAADISLPRIQLTVFIYIEIILVIFPKIATDETMNHPELIMPPIHCAGRINLHQPGMSFRISVPDNGKHILKGCSISILEYNCRLPKFFHHDISFRSVIELDISYWIHF